VFAAGKDRRAARAAVLTELGVIETARWADPREDVDTQYRQLRAAIRQLQTAALIAQVPRRPVVLYSQFALAAFWYIRGEIEKVRGDPDLIGLPTGFYDTVYDAADMVSKAAWSSPATRWLWLPWRHLRLDRRARAIKDSELAPLIAGARRHVR
jgi:hypothetical protein